MSHLKLFSIKRSVRPSYTYLTDILVSALWFKKEYSFPLSLSMSSFIYLHSDSCMNIYLLAHRIDYASFCFSCIFVIIFLYNLFSSLFFIRSFTSLSELNVFGFPVLYVYGIQRLYSSFFLSHIPVLRISLFFFLLKLLGWRWLIGLCNFQVYISIIPGVHIAFHAHHRK